VRKIRSERLTGGATKVSNRYRVHLQTAVASSAAPYGYTLTIWTSGAVITHAQGLPTGLEAVLFMLGAIAGFFVVGAAAHGSPSGFLRPPESTKVRLWGGFHLPSVGLAIAGAALVSELVHNSLAWFLVGFVITAIYLTVIAAQFSIAESSRPASGGDQDRPDTTEVHGSAERPEATDAG
jgi:hypothetical protein